MDIYFFSGNDSKVNEANNFAMQKFQGEFHFIKMPIKYKEIQSLSQEHILLYKKQQVGILDKYFIIDETGLFFENYNNYPGTFTKYVFRALNFDGVFKLLNENNSAYYQTTILLCDPAGKHLFFTGRLYGKITFNKSRQFNYEFPFSSIFIPRGYDNPLIELYQENDFLDHRKLALNNTLEYLKSKLTSRKLFLRSC